MGSYVLIKWSGNEYRISVEEGDTVESLKRKIEAETKVQPKRQKLLGLKDRKGKGQPEDGAVLSDQHLKPGHKILLVGTVEAAIEATIQQAEAAPNVQDDFDIAEGELQEIDAKDKEENQEKLRRRIASVDLKVMHPPRPGKKCLVLDIDYTLFDLGSSAERAEELARPYLHEFLAETYPYYDIIIWSATSMKWVEVKMRELGVLSHPQYSITCMLDHQAMITVQTKKYGVFDCKPLAFLWAKFPMYTEDNTIMIDDLRRNYIMNKQNGLVIRPFRKAHLNRNNDRELLRLKLYLLKIAQLDTLRHLKHRKWELYIAEELDQLERS